MDERLVGAGTSSERSSAASAPGSSQAASAPGSRITGIRSWIGRMSSFGSQVTIAQLCRTSSLSLRGSAAQIPANANSSPSGRLSQTGRLPRSSTSHS